MTTVVLPGREIFERGRRLIGSMISAPPNLDGFGGAVVAVFCFGPNRSAANISPIIHQLLRANQGRYENQENADSDFRILMEAVVFSASMLAKEWEAMAPRDFGYHGWQFVRWLDTDLVIRRQ